MQRARSLFLVTTLLLAAFVPLAAAEGWRHRGTWEPDTLQDVEGGYMWMDPDTSSDDVHRVYFNGYRSNAEASYNPNVAALGSRHQHFGETQFVVMLGFWKDCNGDGYVGSTEYGLQEYRAELLLDSGTCPVKTAAPLTNGNRAGYIYPHNDGTWIRELIWIGAKGFKGGPITTNPTYFAAPGTLVWGLFGLPGDQPPVLCPTTGSFTLSSAGGFLNWLDCFAGYRVMPALNDVGDPVGGWNVEDPENSDNALNNLGNPAYTLLYGPDHTGHEGGVFARDHADDQGGAPRAWSAWDCNGGTVVTDPTGGALSGPVTVADPGVESPDPALDRFRDENGNVVTGVQVFNANGERVLVTPAPSVGDAAGGSYYEPVNETYNVATTGECYPYNHELVYPQVEGNTGTTNAIQGRYKTDMDFIFSAGSRQTAGANVMGNYWPADLGLAPNRELDTVGSSWRENTNYATTPQSINRATLALNTQQFITYYAQLGPQVFTSGLQVPNGGAVSIFGYEACGDTIGEGQPMQNGWECDLQAWRDGCLEPSRDFDRTDGRCVILGDAYHMRDIDCEDGRVARLGGGLEDVAVYTAPGANGPDNPKCPEPGIYRDLTQV